MKSKVLATAFILIACACYGFVAPVLRLSYHAHLSTADMTNVQFLIASVLFLVFAALQRSFRRLSRRQFFVIAAIAACNIVFTFAYYRALTVLSASTAIVLLFQFAWMALVIDAVWHRRWPRWSQVIGMLGLLAGTVLAVGSGSTLPAHGKPLNSANPHSDFTLSTFHMDLRLHPLWAVLFGLLAALCYAVTLHLSSIDGSKQHSVPVTSLYRAAVITWLGTLFNFVPFPPAIHLIRSIWSGDAILFGLLLAALSQVVPILLMLSAVPVLGGRMAAVLGTVELPVTIVAAHYLNGDVLSVTQIGGILLILCGITISEWGAFHQ